MNKTANDMSSTDVSVKESPEPSCVSIKSDESIDKPVNFRSSHDVSVQQKETPEPSYVSIKSDESIDKPVNFRSSADERNESVSDSGKELNSIFEELENKIMSLMKNELKRFKRILSPDYPACSKKGEEDDEGQSRVKEGLLKITLHVLKKMNHKDLADTLQTKLSPLFLQKHKSILRTKFQNINEGISNQEHLTLLNNIYTELYITEGRSREVNSEHEVRRIEALFRRPVTQETPIKCNDIFKALPEHDKPIRTVLTKGVAGIGKTVSVQKFILDWAERKANQDVHFIFPLPFRELNLMKEKHLSLMDLLHQFFTNTKELRSTDFDDYKVLFIFDGLDECRLPLDFQNNKSLSDVRESASVDVLLTNLIKGNLLPSALLWITSRPAAANQIPPECVGQLTEVQGFNDPQKDEYFRKRINDKSLYNRIIRHIKSSKSLYIMCHIPVFCWISATVLETMLSEAETAEIPKTLTQMFTHFLIFQTKLKSQKYDGKCEVDLQQARKSIVSLGKLAFEQLKKGNLIFYEEDLKECGIDVREASVYSGVCTQIFREEFGLYLGKMFSFVHLSVQEFLAALFKFLSLLQRNTGFFHSLSLENPAVLLKKEVDRALRSETGHLDLQLRFLLGLSVESNQCLLQCLLTPRENLKCQNNFHKKEEIVDYIKKKIKENPSPEKSINLFHCLNELNDHSLVQEVQTYLNRTGPSGFSGVNLSPAQWSALVFVLLNSEEELEEFKLSKYDPSEDCLLKLLPVVKASRKADVSDCNLTEKSCLGLASVLCSNSLSLQKLNLSDNSLQDSGVKLLSTGLKNAHCTLKALQLCDCNLTEKSCSALALALSSKCLRELNLSDNNLQDSGVKLLSDGLKNPNCKLVSLNVTNCNLTEKSCLGLASVLRSNCSSLRELNLSNNNLQDSGMKLLSDGLENSHCKLETLKLSYCKITKEGCVALASALRLNPSHLRELNLSGNEPEDSGAKLLFKFLDDQHCKLEKLQICDCNIAEEGCAALTSALISNPSHLRELDLNGNKPGDLTINLLSDLLKDQRCKLEILALDFTDYRIRKESCAAMVSALRSNPSHLRELKLTRNKLGDSGVKLLCELLQDPLCKLDILNLSYSNLGEESCFFLFSALRSNPFYLRELDLTFNKPGKSGVKLLSNLLKDPNCRLEKLDLSCNSLEGDDCFRVISALRSNPSHMRELNLTCNRLEDSGVKLLSDLLQDPQCKLEILNLSGCSIEEEGFASVASAMRSNPSHLRELNLKWNDPGQSGMKLLCDLLRHQHCRIRALKLYNCNLSEVDCVAVVSALWSNPSHLRVLNLNYNELGESGVKMLSALLKDPHCKLHRLLLSECSIKKEGCAALASALRSNPSHLRELSLKGNEVGNSGAKLLSDLLENPHCKLEKLQLSSCRIKEEGCAALASPLRSNLSRLRELDLSKNKPGDIGVKMFSDLLQNSHCILEKLKI